MSLEHCKSIKAGDRKGGSEGPPLVPFAGCPVATFCPFATKSVSQVPSCSPSAFCCSLVPQHSLDLGQSGHTLAVRPALHSIRDSIITLLVRQPRGTAMPGGAQAGLGWGLRFIESVCKMI